MGAVVDAGLSDVDRQTHARVIRRSPSAPAGHRLSKEDERRRKAEQQTEGQSPERAAKAKDMLARIRGVFVDDVERSVGDIAKAIGSQNWALVTELASKLTHARELVVRIKGGRQSMFRRATPEERAAMPATKFIAVPTFDTHAFTQRLEQLLASGASYDVRELVRNMRNTWPQADDANVTATLEQLDKAGRVERVALGSTLRYRRTAQAVSA